MTRRRAVAALIAASALAMGVLSGCSTGPTDQDRADWVAWGDALIADGGGMGGPVASDAADEGIRLEFASPERFTAVELRCIGTDRAQFTLRYTGTADSQTLTQEVVCHDGGLLTPIAIPTTVGDLTAFAATATSPDGEGYWVAIPQR